MDKLKVGIFAEQVAQFDEAAGGRDERHLGGTPRTACGTQAPRERRIASASRASRSIEPGFRDWRGRLRMWERLCAATFPGAEEAADVGA
ncbi:MAG: hypothetical protein C0502_01130 [Opitutus sp.]|nr:hypothetical protein [Opitutus sp.]